LLLLLLCVGGLRVVQPGTSTGEPPWPLLMQTHKQACLRLHVSGQCKAAECVRCGGKQKTGASLCVEGCAFRSLTHYCWVGGWVVGQNAVIGEHQTHTHTHKQQQRTWR
jgi:hypothetical protein